MRGFERRLERMVEGTFSRLFRSGLKPVELGRRLVREMDANRSVGVGGERVAPNHFTIELSPVDAEHFAEVGESIRRELADAAREHARDEGYSFLGPIRVEMLVSERLKTGNFRMSAKLSEGDGGSSPGSLVLPDGQRIVLGEAIFSIGRLADCTLVLEDGNVSRRHAEIRPFGNGFKLVDLGSTNGSTINGERVAERQLRDGDVLEFGNMAITFEAS
ncbi:MAG: FhaA domain-containing protein [Acidimicrobiales bacterium]